MNNLSSRTEQIYDLRLLTKNINFQPEQTILVFSDSLRLDIGSLCYLNGGPVVSKNSAQGRKVDLGSFDHTRVSHVRALIKHIAQYFLNSKRNPLWLFEITSRFVTFVVWADARGYHSVLDDVDTSKSVAKLYVAFLHERFTRNEISAAWQREIVNSLVTFLGEYYGLADFNLSGKKIYKLPLSDDDFIELQPEKAILSFANAGRIDVGMLCYTKIIANNTINTNSIGLDVDLDSFDHTRVPKILALIKHISYEYARGKLKPNTIRNRTVRFKAFIAWADNNGHYNVLANVEAAKSAVSSYKTHVHDIASSKGISKSDCNKNLNYVISMLSCIFGVDTFFDRVLDIYDLSVPRNNPISQPELVVLKIDGKSANIGSLCYLKRNKETDSKKERNVDTDSFYSARVPQIRKIITLIENKYAYSGLRPATLHDKINRFIVFIEWADAHGQHLVLDNVDAGRLAARGYVAHIRERVAMNEISQISGAHQQWASVDFLGEYFGVDNFLRGLNLLYRNPSHQTPTPPPSQDATKKVYAMCECLFTGYTELVLDKKTFPYKLEMPEYLDWAKDGLWLFPINIGFMTPYALMNQSALTNHLWAYNFKEGRLATIAELQEIDLISDRCNASLRKTIRHAQIKIDSANTNPRDIRRLLAGQQALNIFIVMFLAQTGMNWAQIENQQWLSDYEVGAERQGFRSIKPRAGNREVYFELPIQFMPVFRRFLELRQYLLNGRTYDLLFFGFGFNLTTGRPQKIKDIMGSTFKSLRRIDPNLPTIKSRQWRAALSDWLIRNTSPSTTAMILQNTEKTVLASYSTGTESSQIEELTEFFDNVSTVLSKNHVIDKTSNLAIGVCSSQGEPHQISINPPVQPDCKKVEGCFFCDKFKVHADEKDARKLLSCRYFLTQTSVRFNSREQFNLVVGPVIGRIDSILKEVNLKDGELVPRVTREVEEGGDLDPYWASKLEMFMELSA